MEFLLSGGVRGRLGWLQTRSLEEGQHFNVPGDAAATGKLGSHAVAAAEARAGLLLLRRQGRGDEMRGFGSGGRQNVALGALATDGPTDVLVEDAKRAQGGAVGK